jgi:D-arabinose 1-dehydrogenase-like Zn-dependent alcohol dehydrogenase
VPWYVERVLFELTVVKAASGGAFQTRSRLRPEKEFTREEMLDDITLHWLTNTGTSSARPYRENNANNLNAVDISLSAAITVFPGEISMKVAQIPKPGADFQIVEREIPEPGAGEVRIKVQACGVCHSDLFTKEGAWPGIQYPRVPGHEVAGIIDEIGAGVSEWKKGRRVGVGWHGGQDGTCLQCRRGDFRNCLNLKVPGISYDGGYQQYMVAPVEALAAVPETLSDSEAAPLLCAGITTFNALRHSGAMPGDLVAVQGIGGLGHLGVQFANKFGYTVAAIGRGAENARLAEKLGASVYIDSKSTNAAEALQKMGGAQVILATAPSSKAMSELIDGLGPNGKLMVVGVSLDPIEVTPIQLISRTRTIEGWAAGTPTDSEDTMRFAELTGVRPMIETYPLEMAGEAYARMISGDAQFRVVLTM